jgi:hypothetical protein
MKRRRKKKKRRRRKRRAVEAGVRDLQKRPVDVEQENNSEAVQMHGMRTITKQKRWRMMTRQLQWTIMRKRKRAQGFPTTK